MDFDRLISRTTDSLTVGRAFGTPIERDGVVIIPVAMVAGGGGGGEPPSGSPDGAGSGGGLGGFTRPLGVYVVKDGKVRWVPAVNATLIVIAAFMALRRLADVAIHRHH